MSDWIRVNKEDINFDGDDIEIWIESDDFGNRYIQISLKELLQALSEHKITVE